MQKVFKFLPLGLEVEIGKYACQADGAAWVKLGNNIVLSTAVQSKEAVDFAGFFPLTVEYRERSSAAGRIPGGYIKREGKLSDSEVLASRFIDRPIRPLFPSEFFNEVQILSTVYSADGKFPTNILALLGSSIALTISKIPFMGPVGAVSIGRIDGQFKLNLGYQDNLKSDVHIVVAGTIDGISMVEGHCDNLSEQEMVDIFFLAHEEIKKQIEWQLEIAKELNVVKNEFKSNIDWASWKEKTKKALPENFAEAAFISNKIERRAALEKLNSDFMKSFEKEIESEEISKSILQYLFESLMKDTLPDLVCKKGYRLDGRKFDQVRPITAEVSVLPCAHGSAIFKRGETQALSSITLATAQDAQKIEDLIGGVVDKTFMLHYNFLPFSTGEVKMMRGVGRREIGHGYLAENSFMNVLPDKEKFPYTIRSVVDVLESNGSSSMATVCATTLGLMDAGVPIKDMVSGVAMGLLKDKEGNFQIVTDILGDEDALGLMDFKVTGNRSGIMAIQMDIKAKAGLTKDLLQKALNQAKLGRLHILDEMCKVMDKPRESTSALAPKVYSFNIASDKIGLIIGPSGKTIKSIISQTETQIDIEDSGRVSVYAKNTDSAQAALSWIKILAGQIEIGSTFDGVIRKIVDFGIFVELIPGKDGLVHISTISKSKQQTVLDDYKVNDKLKVKVVDFDKDSGRVYLVAPELEK